MTRKPPSFKNFQSVSRRTSYTLSKSRHLNTKCEILLRRALWRKGFRYRKNLTDLPGKPDLAFSRERVVVFCDGDFWHGRNWPARRRRLKSGSNAGYWLAKIETNIERDRRNDAHLTALGWSIVHLWESDILANPGGSANRVAEVIASKRSKVGTET